LRHEPDDEEEEDDRTKKDDDDDDNEGDGYSECNVLSMGEG